MQDPYPATFQRRHHNISLGAVFFCLHVNNNLSNTNDKVTQLYSEKADITSLSDYVSYANLPKNFKFLNLKYDTASSYDTEVLQYIESLEKAVFIIYCEHGSASMYMGFIVSDGKYGTVLRFEYNSLYINGCSGYAWAGWTKLR